MAEMLSALLLGYIWVNLYLNFSIFFNWGIEKEMGWREKMKDLQYRTGPLHCRTTTATSMCAMTMYASNGARVGLCEGFMMMLLGIVILDINFTILYIVGVVVFVLVAVIVAVLVIVRVRVGWYMYVHVLVLLLLRTCWWCENNHFTNV